MAGSAVKFLRELPSGYQVIIGVLAVLLLVLLLFRLVREPQISVEELRQVWRADLKAVAHLHRSNPLLRPGDIPELEQRFGSLRLDLREDVAHVELGTRSWSGGWKTNPAQGSAPSILVLWEKGSPVGRSTSFNRDDGMIILTTDAMALPLRLDDGSSP